MAFYLNDIAHSKTEGLELIGHSNLPAPVKAIMAELVGQIPTPNGKRLHAVKLHATDSRDNLGASHVECIVTPYFREAAVA